MMLVGVVLVVVAVSGWGRWGGRLGEGWMEDGNEWAERGAGDWRDGRGDRAVEMIVEVF